MITPVNTGQQYWGIALMAEGAALWGVVKMLQSLARVQNVFKGAMKDDFVVVISLTYILLAALFSLSFILMC